MSRLQLPKLQIQFQSNDRSGSMADAKYIPDRRSNPDLRINRSASPSERAVWRRRARFYAPLHAKGGLEEFGRLVGDTAQSAGAMQVNHRGVAADAGFCRSAPGALRVSFASKSIHAVLAPRAYGT